MTTARRRRVTSLYAGVLFAVLGVVAWASGQPFVFPSLGPSAFLLAFERRGDRTYCYRVVGSHCIGVVAGLASYVALGAGVSLTPTPPALSTAGFHLVASGVCSVVLTSWGMIATDTNHAPACATTLIVSLGLLSTPARAAVIVVGVVVLVATHALVVRGFDRLVGESGPSAAD